MVYKQVKIPNKPVIRPKKSNKQGDALSRSTSNGIIPSLQIQETMATQSYLGMPKETTSPTSALNRSGSSALRTKVFDIDQKSHIVVNLTNNVSTAKKPKGNNADETDIHLTESGRHVSELGRVG